MVMMTITLLSEGHLTWSLTITVQSPLNTLSHEPAFNIRLKVTQQHTVAREIDNYRQDSRIGR